MISLASVTISLTVGLVLMQYGHGQVGFSNNTYAGIPNNTKTLRIEATMEEDKRLSGEFYNFPKDGIFEINNSKTCPSNQCKFILEMESDPIRLLFTDKYMMLSGDYRLQDNITNGHFTPKKQKLVEEMGFHSQCYFDDIQENLKNGTTKYICSGKHDEFAGTAMGAHAFRHFNDTWYPYTFSASFELPSRHFVFNAKEMD